jgi:hypothetical protein
MRVSSNLTSMAFQQTAAQRTKLAADRCLAVCAHLGYISASCTTAWSYLLYACECGVAVCVHLVYVSEYCVAACAHLVYVYECCATACVRLLYNRDRSRLSARTSSMAVSAAWLPARTSCMSLNSKLAVRINCPCQSSKPTISCLSQPPEPAVRPISRPRRLNPLSGSAAQVICLSQQPKAPVRVNRPGPSSESATRVRRPSGPSRLSESAG